MNIADAQIAFMPGKSCADAIFVIRRYQEKFGEKKKKLYHIFADLEKAFDRVSRKAIVWAVRRQGIPERLIGLVICGLYLQTFQYKSWSSSGIKFEPTFICTS